MDTTPISAAPAALLERAGHWPDLTRWERAEIGRSLRRLGWTYAEIMAVIPVPKGTLSYWCKEIRLSDEQIAAIKARTVRSASGQSRKGVPRDTQRKRREQVARIRAEARAEVAGLLTDPFWVAGTCLYWAEGAKTRPELTLTNTDARVLRIFIAWVRTYHDPAARLVLSLHLHEGNDEAAARSWWTDALHLPNPDFYKTFIKPKGTGHRKNHLEQGVCRVRVRRSADVWVRTMGWIEGLAEYLDTRALEMRGC